jgi:hypothetical protein
MCLRPWHLERKMIFWRLAISKLEYCSLRVRKIDPLIFLFIGHKQIKWVQREIFRSLRIIEIVFELYSCWYNRNRDFDKKSLLWGEICKQETLCFLQKQSTLICRFWVRLVWEAFCMDYCVPDLKGWFFMIPFIFWASSVFIQNVIMTCLTLNKAGIIFSR